MVELERLNDIASSSGIGGIFAAIGTATLHPAAGPLLGGATVFMLSKHGTLTAARSDLQQQRT